MSSSLPPEGGPRATPAGPVPGWVWGVLAGLLSAAVLSLAVSLWLGEGSLVQGGEGHSAYAVKRQKTRVPVERVSASVPEARAVPLEMPVPTEVPPIEMVLVPEQVVSPSDVSSAVPPPQPLAVVAPPANPRWVANAVAADVPAGAPRVALVIDDMGFNRAFSERALRVLPAGVTFSFLPYGEASLPLARQAREERHEVMVHIPMQPLPHGDMTPDMGPHGLQVGMSPAEIGREMDLNLAALADLAVGANNHMGSRFTAWPDGMRAVLTVLQREGLMFLDSKTAAATATQEASAGLSLPLLHRDVFLDHVTEPAEVRAELAKAVRLARKKGFAVVIAHPLPVTLDVLEAELPGLVSSGIVLVPVSQVMTH